MAAKCAFGALLLDLDGVVYVENQVIPGVPETVQELRAQGVAVRFVTNNPTKSRADVVAKLTGMGVETHENEVITSGYATADWLVTHGYRRSGLLGNASLRRDFEQAGIEIVTENPPVYVVGRFEEMTYWDLVAAHQAILGGALYVATDYDAAFPTPSGSAPATGCAVASVEFTTGIAPISIGKPGRAMYDLSLRGLPPGTRAAMVGDTVESDIVGALAAGITAILVDPQRRYPDPPAHFVVDHLRDVLTLNPDSARPTAELHPDVEVTATIPAAVQQRLVAAAADRRIPLSELVADLLEQAVAEG